MWDYNELPTRIMRKAAGFLLQSPRMPFGKRQWAYEIFLNATIIANFIVTSKRYQYIPLNTNNLKYGKKAKLKILK